MQFTKLEKRIRLNWLIANFIPLACCIVYRFFNLFSLSMEKRGWLFILVIILSFCLLIKYWAAYKTPGTVYLLLCLIADVYRLLHFKIDLIHGPGIFYYFFGRFVVLYSLYILVLDFCLMKVNLNIKIQTSDKEYDHALYSLRIIKNLNELKLKCRDILKKWPDQKRDSLKQYLRQKKILLEK